MKINRCNSTVHGFGKTENRKITNKARNEVIDIMHSNDSENNNNNNSNNKCGLELRIVEMI